VLGRETNVRVGDLLVSMNEERVREGLQPLAVDNRLSDAAYKKAIDMIQKQYWAHESPDGVKPWKWLADSGYNYTEAGENLARGFTTGQEVTSAWLASPSHRSNVLGASYANVGFAVV